MKHSSIFAWITVFALSFIPWQGSLAQRVSPLDLNRAAGIIPNFGEVDSNVYRGGEPDEAGLTELKKSGIRKIICFLRDENKIAQESAVCTSLGLKFVSIPLDGLNVPTGNDIKSFLDSTKNASEEPVFIHCHRGSER